MTSKEAAEHLRLPEWLIRQYDSLGLGQGKQAGRREYDDEDIHNLGLMHTLYDLGFCDGEVCRYIRLQSGGRSRQREMLAMLGARRAALVDKIHRLERLICRLDYLRFRVSGQAGRQTLTHSRQERK